MQSHAALAETDWGGPRLEPDVDSLRAVLFDLWPNLIRKRAPEILPHLEGDWLSAQEFSDVQLLQQTQNIKFQLIKIAGENAAVCARRITENKFAQLAIEGSFAKVLRESRDATLAKFSLAKDVFSVGPTLTAHPTEAKRVTVLEILRRIYRAIVSLETHRWAPTERQEVLCDIEGEIDLVWLTGELWLKRPTPGDEIEWGLHFFRDSLFDAVPNLFARFQSAIAEHYGLKENCTPCSEFHS
ncbi:MAG: phosphoenolpyruvate carboxylase [Paracoccaceae bacterium]